MTKRILFVLAAVILAGTGLYYRSLNARTAATKAGQIQRQDAAATPTTTAIAELKAYVGSHMGANVSFQLDGSYARAQAAAKATAAAQAATGQIYADAQKACSGKSDSITQAKCNQDYLSKHLTAQPQPTPVAAPSLTDFRYNLPAPVWTPDLAGALLLGAVASGVLSLLSLFRRRY